MNSAIDSLNLGVQDHFWTAGTNLGNEPYFFWMGHDEPISFNDWANGEPNNYNLNEDCIELKFVGGTWKWNDTACDSKLYFVCEEDDLIRVKQRI